MAAGYIGKKPDLTYWTRQMTAGIEYRKKLAMENSWPLWNNYYRGHWKSGIMPVNMFFSMLRQTVPRTYFRNPAVSVSPDQPGFLAMAFAQILNRIDNKIFQEIGMKREMKRIVQEAWLKGTGFGKLGLGAEFSPSGEPDRVPLNREQERTEYNFDVQPKWPWFKRTNPGTVILPDGLQVFEDARWWAHHIRRTREDLLADKRLNSKAVRSIPSTGLEGSGFGDSRSTDKTEMVDLIEVHDRKFNLVFVYSMFGGDKHQMVIDPQDDALANRRPNIYPLIFNQDDDNFWGVPDAAILEPPQLELNETNTLIMKHRRLSIVKFLVKKGVINEDQIANMLSEDVSATVEISGELSDVNMQQVADIPQGLIQAKSLVMQDIRDQMGFSRNQLGDFQSRRGDTSATEAAIVNQGSEIRIDERRDAVADMMQNVAIDMNEIIFTHWDERQVFELVGPGGVPVWVEARPSQLALSRYKVRVDPDSGIHKTREQREEKSVGIYNLLKTNPMIDPLKLTQYLLAELEGVQLDDLMRALPPVPGFEGQQLNPAGFGDLLQDGFKQLATAGPQQIPAGGGGA